MLANSLNNIALPSITGMAASGPMLPSPSTADPSLTTATELCLMVSVLALRVSAAIASQTRATPGRVRHRERIARRQRNLVLDPNLAAEMHQEDAVGNVDDLDPLQAPDAVDQRLGVRIVACRDRDVAHLERPGGTDDVNGARVAFEPGDGVEHTGEHAGLVDDAHAHREAVTDRGGEVGHRPDDTRLSGWTLPSLRSRSSRRPGATRSNSLAIGTASRVRQGAWSRAARPE